MWLSRVNVGRSGLREHYVTVGCVMFSDAIWAMTLTEVTGALVMLRNVVREQFYLFGGGGASRGDAW